MEIISNHIKFFLVYTSHTASDCTGPAQWHELDIPSDPEYHVEKLRHLLAQQG